MPVATLGGGGNSWYLVSLEGEGQAVVVVFVILVGEVAVFLIWGLLSWVLLGVPV